VCGGRGVGDGGGGGERKMGKEGVGGNWGSILFGKNLGRTPPVCGGRGGVFLVFPPFF